VCVDNIFQNSGTALVYQDRDRTLDQHDARSKEFDFLDDLTKRASSMSPFALTSSTSGSITRSRSTMP